MKKLLKRLVKALLQNYALKKCAYYSSEMLSTQKRINEGFVFSGPAFKDTINHASLNFAIKVQKLNYEIYFTIVRFTV